MTNRNIRTRYPTKLPQLPDPPASLDHQTRQYLSKLSENIQIRQGLRGDPRDRAVTLRELIESGLAKELKVRPFDPNNLDNLDFLPPQDDLTIPPQPTNFTATAGYSQAILFWDFPEYGNHAYTEVWRHDSDVLGDAQVTATVRVNGYSDPIGGGVTRYYWIRHVSTAGVFGPWFSTSGASVTIPTDTNVLLTALNNSITESQLTTALQGRIDLVDAADTVAGSVNKRLEDQRLILQAQLDDLSAIAAYDAGTTYNLDDLVTSGGFLYRALQTTTGNAPPNATYWELVGEYSSLGDAVAGNTSDISAINFIDASSSSAAAVAIKNLQTSLTTTDGNVSTNASNISSNSTNISTNAGNITTNSGSITALENTVNNGSTGVAANASNIASNAANISTNGGNISTNASSITALENTVNNGTTGVAANASAISGLTTDVSTNAGNISTNSGSITALQSTVNNPTTGVAANASNISTNSTSISTNAGNISANSSSISTLSTTVGNNTTSIQTNATSINGIHGQYTVKIDVNGRVAGFGLSNTSATYDGGIHSEFTVLADRFNIVNQTDDGDIITPFTVVTTPFTNNGVTVPAGTYIDEAFIRNGSITTARIGSLAVDSAKIANLAVVEGKIATAAITTAKIADAAITTAKIANAAITNALIGNAEITSAKIADLAVDTIKIAGGAVSDSAFTASAGSIATINHAARSGSVLLYAIFYPSSTSSRTVALYRDAVVLRTFTISGSVPIMIMFVDTPGTATYTYRAQGTGGFNATELLLLEVVR